MFMENRLFGIENVQVTSKAAGILKKHKVKSKDLLGEHQFGGPGVVALEGEAWETTKQVGQHIVHVLTCPDRSLTVVFVEGEEY